MRQVGILRVEVVLQLLRRAIWADPPDHDFPKRRGHAEKWSSALNWYSFPSFHPQLHCEVPSIRYRQCLWFSFLHHLRDGRKYLIALLDGQLGLHCSLPSEGTNLEQ